MKNQFDDIAEQYDDDIYPLNEKEFVNPTVEALAKLAPGKRVLELGIGTGRIAIPLANRGFQVTGVDLSEHMLQQLKGKAGGEQVHAVQDDMSKVQLDETFDLAYCIFNGITYLLTLDEQVACIQNAAHHLASGGIFVLETFIPRVEQIVKDDTAPYALEESYVGFDKYDRINQRLTSYQFDLSAEAPQSFQSTHRYVWPSELELMGRLAGLTLLNKWGDWDGEALDNESDNVILVWQKP